jgi:tetratricopeptide (TPR) repeat protein
MERALGRPTESTSSPPSSCLILPQGDIGKELALSSGETRFAKKMAAFCLDGSYNILCLSDPPRIGSSLLAYAVATVHLHPDVVTSTYMIFPHAWQVESYLNPVASDGDDAEPFMNGLQQLAGHLGFQARPSAAELLVALLKSKSTLFVLLAHHVPDEGSSYIGSLLDEACRAKFIRPMGTPVPIVLIGQPQGPWITSTSSKARSMTDARDLLPFGTLGGKSARERDEFYKLHWKRYRAKRGNESLDEPDSGRLKHARLYYGSKSQSPILPGTLRMLAFVASNDENKSYFDPTSGWDRLAGSSLIDLPIEIQLHLAEVVGQARSIGEKDKRSTTLRAIRWCSTAVYWLTEDAVEDIGSRLKPKTNLESFRNAIQRVDEFVEVLPQNEGESLNYRMDIALRAVVQTRWVRLDALGRATVHHQIAWRLLQLSHSKETLKLEYPFRPHWGRSRMHFLAECLRHLIRSCDEAPRCDQEYEYRDQDAWVEFPRSPAEGGDWRSNYPIEAVNYCFGQIFWQQLNGNATVGTVHNRKLSRQHGAYQLTTELLQLMSGGGQLGEPHWALHSAHRLRYLREVGYAQLDLGELHAAKGTFEKLISCWRKDGGEPSDGVDFRLDLMIVVAAMNELVAARRIWKEAYEAFEALPSLGVSNSSTRRTRQGVSTRLAARQAHLMYLEGNWDGSLQACLIIEHDNPSAIARDVAHTYIATLGALGGIDRLNKATTICVRNLFKYTSSGLHHEALGFRVALGHAFRKLGMLDVAEVTLDQVSSDVSLYGCSERTYIAMLLEAGRIVLAQGRYARAYAAYLRPCYERARFLGYVRHAETAKTAARESLQKLIGVHMDSPIEKQQLLLDLEGRDADKKHGYASSEADPIDAFDNFLPQDWLHRLETLESIRSELAQLC